VHHRQRTAQLPARRRAARVALAIALAALAVMPAAAAGAGDPLRDEQWWLDAIHADAAHEISIGTGAVVAVLDSGVDASHPDLAGSLIAGPDLIDGDGSPDDENGHGTNVAGIIAARTGNGIGVASAAPGAKVLAIRVLDAANRGNTDVEAAGIDAAVAAGADVINISINPTGNIVTQLLPADRLVQAIERAAGAGVVIVASAGNQGLPLCSQPLLTSKILCVGAVNRARLRPSYSNYLLRVDIAAPGGEARSDEDIISTGPGGAYFGLAGTSQATPQVSAAAALLVSLGLSGRAVIDRLEQTATDLGLLDLGHGLLDMGAAVAGLGPPLPAAAPLAARTSRRLRQATVRRLGLPVVCTSVQAGVCRVRVTNRGRLIARGSRAVAVDVATKVRARLTAAGRRALDRSRRVGARIDVTGPTLDAVILTTTLVR
jgi:subtilisin family serine protease